MIIRRATSAEAGAMARVLAAVAEEGLIGTEPPVDIEALAQRFRETLDENLGPGGMWVLDDDGRVVGTAGAHASGPTGVLSRLVVDRTLGALANRRADGSSVARHRPSSAARTTWYPGRTGPCRATSKR